MASLYRNNRTFFGIEDETWTALAIWSIIAVDGINYNINRVLNFFLKQTTIWDSVVIETMSAIFILLGTATALKKMQRREFVLVIFVALAWILSYVLNEDARIYLTGSYFSSVLIYGTCGIVCIARFNNWERFVRASYFFVIIGLASFFVRSVIVINDKNYMLDYMSFSYANLVFVVAAFWVAFHKKKIIMWIIAAFAIIMLMIVGSRGALLCALIYILLEFLLSKKIHITMKFLFFLLVTVIFFNLENIMLWINGILTQYGYQSRTILKFLEGTLQDDSGRSIYYKYSWEIVMEHPIFGCGMAGSAALLFEKIHGFAPEMTQGSYSHNLFLDLYMHFGLFLGTFICLWLIINLIRAYRQNLNNNTYNILFFMFSISIPKLMLSSTYLGEPEFFVFLGLLINLCYQQYDKLPQNADN